MPEYLSPDIFVEERESNRHTIERVSASVAAFYGIAERGPVGVPVLITSFAQFRRIFGGYIPNSHLAYAVDGFFKKVKGRCYVSRVVHYTDITDAATSTCETSAATLNDRAGAPVPTLGVKAVSPGKWGDDISVKIEAATNKPAEHFKMKVYLKGTLVDLRDDLSMDAASENYALKRINGVSEFIALEDLGSATAAPENRPAEGLFALSGGDDGLVGIGDVDYAGSHAARTGVFAFDPVDEISILACPGVTTQTVQNALCTYSELRQDIFVILDPPVGMNVTEIKEYVQDTAAFNCRFAALYYPNIVIIDPATGKSRIAPPSGQLAGIYAKTDVVHGVHKAPAGTEDGKFADVIGLEYTLDKGQRDTLYPARVNPIIKKRGVGVVAWGNRTLTALSDWRSINVRRLFLNVVESIAEGTEWAVFKPNNQELWRDLNTTITLFLKEYWREGAFFDGGTGNWRDSFYVKCDAELNTQEIIDQYKVVTEIGIAPTKAAEFVIFRITQWDGGRLIGETMGGV
ncbi:MAG TPA: phage tail sheath subtilisin-like domain-containing protein [bacterium]|nr:phage tail sheath subtilisin-like domain-containing protein [bacterium]